ncbi:ABC transporter substrate-binding protein [Actinocatenispora rupis]|uniref:ABC transporter substrate-binding protein n=1 Tax=Actinocatenispora rupis TaxID=519421 RepID=A0A8J3NFX4_9ACTN|nr:ABC transporter substrate-binding protein [Actinocatenispora rupis]GID15350.1 ABC transporter substrate-binding protein [Actinocatenispora rupis]
MKITRSRLVPVCGLVIGALALTGCGAGHGPAETVHKVGATAGGPMRTGGTLHFGQSQGITQLDPNTIASSSQTQLQTLLWDGLTTYAPDMSVRPDLATSWTHSDDYRHWTFRLRTGVRFDNGKPFTATDAVKNIERVLDPKTAAQAAVKISMIDTVRAVDPATLAVDLKTPNPQLPNGLVDVKMTDVDHIADVNRTANGTGPYKLARFVPNQSVTVVRNDRYWGPRPKFDRIEIQRYADATAAQSAFLSGELDVLTELTPDTASYLAVGTTLLGAPQPAGVAVWELDTRSKPFDNPKARLALSYAADRAAMNQAAYAGKAVLNDTDQPVNPQSPYYASDLPHHAYDLVKAKKLFAEAGVKPGTTLTFWTTAGANLEWTTMGQILQSDLKKIGINLQIRSNEVATWAAKAYPKGKRYPGLIYPNFLSFPPPPADYAISWYSNEGTCECNWTAPDTYERAAGAVSRGAGTDRARGFTDAQRVLNANVPIVTLANTSPLSVAQTNVRGVWVQSEGTLHLERAGFAAGSRS